MAAQRELSPQAQEDLIEIWSYIAQFSEEAADRIIDTIYQKADLLAQSPYMGKERSELHPSLRSFVIEKYVLFYRPIEENGIEVVRVLHGARDIEQLL
ncbi:Plasmid stabilization protein [Hyella patelloides LEGE 07179]|uniref:Toxin n=1 Tax=Hyella patelloides LEGE 07179 TaxID=945734 RepID=A0A563W0X6_9CYAN|nr:type II toxin-antitoxin system RelE/ParE family toxin [Hyella patelloides]VEP17193.1 Plasmid stabilization protein [Hyella patelloides LEGE 07179]